MNVITNNVPRPILDACELTAAERAEFDYLDWDALQAGTDGASFFRYKGQVHDLGEFMVWDTRPAELQVWDGYRSDSFFSALVVKFTADDESVVVGLLLS